MLLIHIFNKTSVSFRKAQLGSEAVSFEDWNKVLELWCMVLEPGWRLVRIFLFSPLHLISGYLQIFGLLVIW